MKKVAQSGRYPYSTLRRWSVVDNVSSSGFPVSTSRKATNPIEQSPCEIDLHRCIDGDNIPYRGGGAYYKNNELVSILSWSGQRPSSIAAPGAAPSSSSSSIDRPSKLASPRGFPPRADRIRVCTQDALLEIILPQCFNRFAFEGGMDSAISKPRSPRSRTPPPTIRGVRRPPLPPTVPSSINNKAAPPSVHLPSAGRSDQRPSIVGFASHNSG